MRTDRAVLAAAAVEAVTLASRLCRDVQARLHAERALAPISKADDSPVTVADFASQAVVAWTLRRRLGPVRLVSEEGPAYLRDPANADALRSTVDAAALVWDGATAWDVLDAIEVGAQDPPLDPDEGFWTLDPIDGTKGFIRGGHYCVCLAWIEGAAPRVAALGCPNLALDPLADPLVRDPRGVVFSAVEGGGVEARHADDRGAAPMRVRRQARVVGSPLRACRSVDAIHSDHSWAARSLRRCADLLGAGRPLEQTSLLLDSQCKYAVVGRGQADAYLRMPTRGGYVERIWDHAPGALIAAELGLTVTDIEGKALDFGRGKGLERNRGVVCTDPGVHEAMLRAIAETADVRL